MTPRPFRLKPLRLAVLVLLWGAAAAPLRAEGQPSQDSEWMLVGPQGQRFYLDGCNLTYCATDQAVLYFGEATVPAAPPAILIDAGVVQGLQTGLGKLKPNQTAVLAKGDALACLQERFPVGTLVSIVPADPFPQFTIAFPFDHLDTLDGGNNDLWVFTPAYHGGSPNSPFRMQAEVQEGRVVRKDGGYARIPERGFLLSGHGTGHIASGSTRVLNWCNLGCRVELDTEGRKVTVTTDQESWFLQAAALAKEAEQLCHRNAPSLGAANRAAAKAHLAAARANLKEARQLAGNGLRSPAWLALRRSMDSARLAAIAGALPVKVDSLRGLCLAGVSDDHLLQLSRAVGANAIILFYDQSTVKDLAGLRRLAKESNRLGMQIILWTLLPSVYPFAPEIAAKLKPDMARDGSPSGYDLSEPETRQALVADLLRACSDLNAVGVLFDYESFTGGYGPSCLANFRRENPDLPAGIDPRTMSAAAEERYEAFRRATLSKVVDETTSALHNAKLQSILCVYPGVDFRDPTRGTAATPGPGVWLPWLAGGRFDSFMPMLYSASPTWLERLSAELFPAIRQASPATRIDPLLIFWPEVCGWLSPIPIANLIAQSDVLLRHGAAGVSYFCAPNLDAQFNPYFAWYVKALRDGVYRDAAGNCRQAGRNGPE